jgi:hypothetical protein
MEPLNDVEIPEKPPSFADLNIRRDDLKKLFEKVVFADDYFFIFNMLIEPSNSVRTNVTSLKYISYQN